VDDDLLQHVYRAAVYVYWVPGTASFEHRDPNAGSVRSSAESIRFAVEGELGLTLEAAESIDWSGLGPDERDAIARAVFS